MMKQLSIICLSILVLGTPPAWAVERGPAVLTQDYSVVARSEDPKHVFLGTPAIARLPSGRYVATYDRFRNDCEGCIVVTSDDRGRTWTERARVALQWASPFAIEQSLFLIGNNQEHDARDIAIARSDNSGQTWSRVRILFQGRYTRAATSVLVYGGQLWRAFETCPPGNENWKSVVVAGNLNRDLLDPASWRIPGRVLGKDGAVPPSEKIILGGIRLGSRGFVDRRTFLEEPDVQFVAVCDVRAGRREHAKKAVDAKYGNQDCATYRDLRDLLARPDIDAVLIATKINWHGLASILAAKDGKDVYCEKPCTKRFAESLVLAETFRRTGRVFQAGTRRRSTPHFMFAVELARTGKLDKLCELHASPLGLGAGIRGPASMEPDLPVPPREKFDWDLWLGLTAWKPYKHQYRRGGDIVGHLGEGITPWGSHT